MGYFKDQDIEAQEDEERQLRQEQYEEEAYQRLLIEEEFNFERDSAERQKL